MTNTINTVIIDDETNSVILLTKMLEKHCPSVNIIGTANSVEEGVECINKYKPSLVFLDINMPDGLGFEIIDKVEERSFEVIFVTAFDSYAMRAFEFSALHYLLKPINATFLQEAVKRYEDLRGDPSLDSKIKILNESLSSTPKKIIITSTDSLNIIELENIIRIESLSNYSTIHLKNNQKIISSRPLNNYEDMLSDLHFFRVHTKHLVNLKYVKRYIKGRGGLIELEDGIIVEVSDAKKREFLRKLSEIARG